MLHLQSESMAYLLCPEVYKMEECWWMSKCQPSIHVVIHHHQTGIQLHQYRKHWKSLQQQYSGVRCWISSCNWNELTLLRAGLGSLSVFHQWHLNNEGSVIYARIRLQFYSTASLFEALLISHSWAHHSPQHRIQEQLWKWLNLILEMNTSGLHFRRQKQRISVLYWASEEVSTLLFRILLQQLWCHKNVPEFHRTK